MFRLDFGVATAGTSLLAVIELPPAAVIGRFGRSGFNQRDPCTGHWSFVSARDEVFTLYEYRTTSAFQRGAIHPADFWALTVPRELHIGGHRDTDLAGFKRWLAEQVQKFQRTGQRAPDVPEEFGREYVRQHLKDCTPAERLEGLSPEQRLAGLSAEQRLQGLSAAELQELAEKLKRKGASVKPE